MKKRTLFSAALAVLLMLTLCPSALAMGSEMPSLDWLLAADADFSLRDYLDGSQEAISIAGTPVDLEHLLFVDDCAVNEEAEICLCEATENAAVLDVNTLPDGCRTELRREKLRRPDAKNGRQIVEEKERERNGLSAVNDEAEALPDDGQEHIYLYLIGRPSRVGKYAFLIWTDQIFYCSMEVNDSVDAPVSASELISFGSDPGTESGQPTEPPADDQLTFTLPTDPPTYDQPTFTLPTDPPTYDQPTEQPGFSKPTEPPATEPPVVIPTLSAPTVTIAGDTTCRPGERAVLEARVSGGENLRYQWYMSLGYYSMPIDGATESYFLPDTSQAGTYSYFCRVTSSAYGQEVYADSDAVLFNVVERQLAYVSIDTMPNKLVYTEGEALNTTGLRLLLRYNDGSTEYATSGFSASPKVITNAGNVNVVITYKGFTVGYTVTVRSILEGVRGIGVLTAPYKTTYKAGESLNTDGLSIRAYTYDGSYFDVDWGLECSPTRFSGSGKQTVTVSYAGKTCTFSVNVEQDNRVTGVWVQNMPANRSYTVGDSINTSGLALQVRTNSGTQTVTSGYSYYPQVATTPGTQTITVTYGGQSTSFTVNVREAQTAWPTATPYQAYTPVPMPTPYQGGTPTPYQTPTPTTALAAGVTPAPSASPEASPVSTVRPTPAPVRKNTGVNGFVKVLFVVAVVALAALIAYVLYLRRQSGEEDFDSEPRPSEKLHDLFNKKDRRDR